MLFGRKKKEQLHKEDLQLADGIYLKPPTMEIGNLIYSCFLRSSIAFFLVLGSVGGFLSALDLSYNYVMVIVAYMILSLYFSFLYALPKFLYRDIGYILFFCVFVFAIYLFRIHANSGLYVVVNTILSRAKSFFELSGVREYETQIDNDYLTVAIVAIFIGMILIIILNIWLYSKMSFVWAVMLTFPLLLIPLYMKLTPDPLYMLLLAIGYTMVVVFKANGHYLAFAWEKPFKVKQAKTGKVFYTQDAGVFQNVLGMVAGFLVCVVFLLQLVVSPISFDGRFQKDTLREKTADVLSNFVLLGFSALYNQYASVGGMSAGKLGGISNVRPDYMTDLIVTYTPYSNQAVYLKAYTGGVYRENQWLDLYSSNPDAQADQADFEDESMRQEARELQLGDNRYYAFGNMLIQNVGADGAYLYYPYYTKFESYSVYNHHAMFSSSQGVGRGMSTEYTYYPKIVWEPELGNIPPADMELSEINEEFLDVPDENREVIRAECEKIGLTDSMTENEITSAVTQYFADEIPYTLSPGATPKGEDFVTYFLTKNRKGYCAHFASAATLIFREMGIPARYVEGYAFSLETVLASEIAEGEDPKNYYRGYSALGDSPVMNVEVTDAMAHAWVEVYVEGFGWKVVEVTPGSAEEGEEDNFWDAFTNAANAIGTDGGNASNLLGDLDLSRLIWFVYLILLVAAVYMIYSMMQVLIRKIRRYVACHQENCQEALIARYANLCDMLRVCDDSFDACRSHHEQLQYMQEHYVGTLDVEQCCRILEEISFSKKSVEEEGIALVEQWIKSIQKMLWKKAKPVERLKLYKR